MTSVMHSYYQVEVQKEGEIPIGEGGFYSPNHQNAIFDPVLPALETVHQLYFMTRSDVFEKPILAKLFDSFKMIPIYRKRDGVDTKVMNAPIFERACQILNTGGAFHICPEGTFERERNLRRPLKKGLARMGFQALEACNFEQDLWVVPIGMYYERSEVVGSKVLMWFGEVMNMRVYRESYERDKEAAIAQFSRDLGDKMQQLIIHIPNGPYYETIECLRDYFEADLAKKWKLDPHRMSCRMLASQQIVANLTSLKEEELEALKGDLVRYNGLLEEQGLRHVSAKDEFYTSYLSYAWKYPLYVYGVANNLVAWHLADRIVEQKTKGEKFKPTVRVVVWVVIFPIVYFLQGLLVAWLTGSFIAMLVYLLTLPMIGRFGLRFHQERECERENKAYMESLKGTREEMAEVEMLRAKLLKKCQ